MSVVQLRGTAIIDAQGVTILVDDDLPSWIYKQVWGMHVSGYARSRQGFLHHAIIGKPPQGMVTDHVNRDKQDCRRQNLRHVSRSTNGLNAGERADNTSGTRGVHYSKKDKRWQAYITINKERYFLGQFQRKETAVIYRKTAEKYLQNLERTLETVSVEVLRKAFGRSVYVEEGELQ